MIDLKELGINFISFTEVEVHLFVQGLRDLATDIIYLCNDFSLCRRNHIERN